MAETPAALMSIDEQGRAVLDSRIVGQLAEKFLGKDFGVEDAERLLGPIADKSNPHNLLLQPKSDTVAQANLGMVGQERARELCYMYVVFSRPFEIDIGPFIDSFGAAKERAAPDPDSIACHIFELKRQDYIGSLMVGLLPGEGNVRQISAISFSRFPAASN